jgi:hypothetical protein
MKKEQFAVIVWHNDDVNGTYQRVLTRGHTAARVMLEFAKYLERPAHCRSFTHKNRAQLHGPDGLICELPMVEEVTA